MNILANTICLILHRYNEEKELSKRYAKFDLEKIVDTAIKATNGKSKYCMAP